MALRHLLVIALAALLAGPADLAAQGRVATPTPRDDDDRPSSRVPSEVAVFRNGRAEFVVSGPPSTSNAAVAALTGAGAELISTRNLLSLNRRVLIFDFRNRLSLERAQDILDNAAPTQFLDYHHLYRYAQSKPRLYAPTLVGVPSGGCRISGSRRIGVIDGPVNPGHPALKGARVTVASTLDGKTKSDNTSHGTAVAALIVGEDASGALAGFASGAHLYAAGAFGKEKAGIRADVDRIGASLNWLLANNVKIINMSFAGPSNRAFEDILRQAQRKGAVMIAAAGNDGRKLAKYPSASPSVIAVTAVDARMRKYRRANWGSHIEFAAPGVDLYVAERSGGGYATGTSYAAPIVTAFAARLGARTADSLRKSLRASAVDLGSPGRDSEFGWGLIRGKGC
ncbi:S8 family serine peptidase [Cognatishimia sp. D5M38]|uniref:S8 family serine peptidase n=1 Tax=Cognatishimia coralii TaxID=3083254 RepID=A0ABU8QKL5_9RHOB